MVQKSVLAVVALLVVGGIGAGAYTLTLGSGPSAVDQVPDGVDTVMRVDAAIADDETTRQLANAGAEQVAAGGGPDNTSEAMAEFENETGLDPDGVDEIVVYGKQSSGMSMGGADYTGIVVHADWNNDDVVAALRNDSDGEYEEVTYKDQRVLRPAEDTFGTDEWFAVLGDGQYVLGTETAVKDAVDVTAGDAQAFDGRLRSAYDDSRDGLVKAAVLVPEQQVPSSGAMGMDVSKYRKVDAVSAVYYTESNAAGVEMRMFANSTEGARDVADVTDGALSIAGGTVENETVKETVRSVEVTREDATVVVSYEESIDTLSDLLAYLRQSGV